MNSSSQHPPRSGPSNHPSSSAASSHPTQQQQQQQASTSTAAAAAAASSSSSSSSSSRHEDLAKTWRTLANCIILASQKADKAVSSLPPEKKDSVSLDRETDEYVVSILRTRVKLARLLGTTLQAEIVGQAQELQALQHYNRSMPRCGRPQKKRQRLDQPVVGMPADATALPGAVGLDETPLEASK